MRRLLALALCLTTLLPAVALAEEEAGRDSSDARPGCENSAWRHGRDAGASEGDRDEGWSRGSRRACEPKGESDEGWGRGKRHGCEREGGRDHGWCCEGRESGEARCGRGGGEMGCGGRGEWGRHERGGRGRYHGRMDFFLRGGFSLSDETQTLGYADGQYSHNGTNGGVAFEAGFRCWLTPNLGVGLAVGYTDLGRVGHEQIIYGATQNASSVQEGQNAYDYRSRLSAFPATALISVRLPVRGFVQPYAEFGAGLYTLRGSSRYGNIEVTPLPGVPGVSGDPGVPIVPPDPVDTNYQYGQSTSQELCFGYSAGAGLEFRARRIGFTLGGRWNVVSADDESFNHATFMAGVVLH